jgi:phosphonate transport system permease protein
MISLISILLVVTIYGFITIDTRGVNLREAFLKSLVYLGMMFGTPAGKPSHFASADAPFLVVLGSSLLLVLKTLALAFLSTVCGALIALVIGLLAARNITNERISNILKSVVAFFRAIPTVLWILIFAIGAGLGSVAAVIGMSFHTVGYLMKAYSESFEELDHSIIEALRASGASWIHIIFQAILPSSFTQILTWTFIRFEINFGVAVAMGAAAGAGGIGFNLFMAAGYFLDIQEIGFITYQILAITLLMEFIATRLKEKYHINN